MGGVYRIQTFFVFFLYLQGPLDIWKPLLVVIVVVVDGDTVEEHVEAVGRGVTEVTVGTAVTQDDATSPTEVTPTLGARHLVAAINLLQPNARLRYGQFHMKSTKKRPKCYGSFK